MTFNIFTVLCKYLSGSRTFPPPQEESPYPSNALRAPPPAPAAPLCRLSLCIALLWTLQIIGAIQRGASVSGCFPLAQSLQGPSMVERVGASLLFLVKCYPTVWTYYTAVMHWLVGGYLGCIHLLAVVHGECLFEQLCQFLGCTPGSGAAGSRVTSRGSPRLPSTAATPATHQGSGFPTSSQRLSFSASLVITIPRGVMCHLSGAWAGACW